MKAAVCFASAASNTGLEAMCDLLREFATATEKLFVPQPQSAEAISERLRAYRYDAFPREEVPGRLKQGFEFACSLDGDRVLLHWPHEGRVP